MARTSEAARQVHSPGVRRLVDPDRLEVAGRQRRRPGWALAGVGLVALAGLGGAWLFAARSVSVPVLVAARDLEAGAVLEAGDLRVVELAGAGGLRAVQPLQQGLIVGRALRGPVPAGTVLNTGLVVDTGEVVPAGQVVVGVALEPGASPSKHLRAGDRVQVLAVARSSPGVATVGSAQVLTVGSVWSVESISTGVSSAGRSWVSLVVPQAVHGDLAQAAAEGRLRLGLLGAGS